MRETTKEKLRGLIANTWPAHPADERRLCRTITQAYRAGERPSHEEIVSALRDLGWQRTLPLGGAAENLASFWDLALVLLEEYERLDT